MKKHTRSLLLAVAVAGCAGAAAAAKLPLETLPANARWMLHLDVQALCDSPLGKELLTALSGMPEKADLKAFDAAFACNIRRDLASVTVCGAGGEELGGVAYLRGNWDLRKLSAGLADHASFATTSYGRHTIMSWSTAKTSKDWERQSVCLLSSNLVLLANREKALRQALDALDGKTPTLAHESRFRRMAAMDTNSFLRVVAVDLQTIAGADPMASALSAGDSLRIAFYGDGQEVRLLAVMQADTPEAALQLQRMLVGLQAVMILQGLRIPEIGKIAKTARIHANGPDVTVVLTASFDTLKHLLFRQKKGLLTGMNVTGKSGETVSARLLPAGP